MSLKSLRRHEGYFMLDHRASPGIPDAIAIQAGLPMGAGKGLFEAPSYTCSHCSNIVVMEPRRTRERGYCPKCDHRVCDTCNAVRVQTGECKPVMKHVEQLYEQAVKTPDSILLTKE